MRQIKHPQDLYLHLLLGLSLILIHFFRNYFNISPRVMISSLLLLSFIGYIKQIHFVGFDEEWLIINGNLWAELGSKSFLNIYTSLPWSGGQHPPGSLFFTYMLSSLGPIAQKIISLMFFILTIPALKYLSVKKEDFQINLILLLSNILFIRLLFGINNDIPLFFSFAWFLVCFEKLKNPVLSGLFFGLSLWIKYFALVYFGLFFVLSFIWDRKQWKFIIFSFGIGLLIFSPWVIVAIKNGIWYYQIQNIFLHAINNPEVVNGSQLGRSRFFFYLPDNIFSVGPIIFSLYFYRFVQLYENQKKYFWFSFFSILVFVIIQPTNRYFLPLYILMLFGQELPRSSSGKRIRLENIVPIQWAIILFYVFRGYS